MSGITGNWENKSEKEIEITASDSTSGVKHITVYDEFTKISTTITNNKYVVKGEGNHTLVITATDMAGNIKTENKNVLLDITVPIITISDLSKLYEQSDSKEFSITVSDKFSKNIKVTVLDGQTELKEENSKYKIKGERKHEIHIKAIDEAGNEVKKDQTVYLDKTAPQIDVKGISSDDWENIKKKEFYVTATDSCSDVESIVVLDNNTELKGENSKYIINSEGEHNIEIKAKDKAGNEKKIEKILRIDFTPPKINDLKSSTDNKTILSDSDFEIELNINESNCNVYGCFSSSNSPENYTIIDGRQISVKNNEYKIKIENNLLNNGKNYIYFYCEDKAKNKSNVVSTYIYKDDVIPFSPVINSDSHRFIHNETDFDTENFAKFTITQKINNICGIQGFYYYLSKKNLQNIESISQFDSSKFKFINSEYKASLIFDNLKSNDDTDF